MGNFGATDIDLTTKRLDSLLNESIVALSMIQIILSSLIPAFKVFQVPVELTLLALLLVGCLTIKLDRWQISLFFLLFIATIFSLLTVDLIPSVTMGKNNILGVLTLIYFSKVPFNSRLVVPVFITTTLLISVNSFNSEIFYPLIELTYNTEFNLSRFGGVFFNAHFNAFFMGIFLIYFCQLRYELGFIGLLPLYLTASSTMIAAYLFQLATILPVTKVLINHSRKLNFIIILFAVVAAIIFIVNYSSILDNLISENEANENRYNSFIVILVQLGEPKYYQQLIQPFPVNYALDSRAYSDYVPTVSGRLHSGENEIGFFSLFNQTGIFLGLACLVTLMKKARFYTVFILSSLIHYNFVLYPISIYLVIEFSRRIQLIRDRRAYDLRNF